MRCRSCGLRVRYWPIGCMRTPLARRRSSYAYSTGPCRQGRQQPRIGHRDTRIVRNFIVLSSATHTRSLVLSGQPVAPSPFCLCAKKWRSHTLTHTHLTHIRRTARRRTNRNVNGGAPQLWFDTPLLQSTPDCGLRKNRAADFAGRTIRRSTRRTPIDEREEACAE